MKNNSMIFALLGVSALLFFGCMKEESINEQYRPAGSEILIGASTDYDNGEATRTEYDSVEPATRTDYSGAIYGSSPKRERIDWLNGDNMTIFYKQGTAAASSGVYGVTSISPSSEKSYADVTNTSGTKLTWGDGTGDHYFYAMYPAKGFGGNNGMDLTNTNHVKGTIPATQDIDSNHKITVDGQLKYQPDMKYAYLVSYKKIDESSTATRAELPFRPAVTTFEYKFKLNANDAATERTITKFTMTASTDLTGVFEFDITGGDERGATWGTVSKSGTGKTITVNFPEGTKLTKTAYLDFSVLALPVQQEDVKITFFFKDGNMEYHKSATIKKGGSNATFAASKKHIITNDALTGEIITYHLDVTPTIEVGYLGASVTNTVTSYKQVGSSGEKKGIRWEVVSYSVNGGQPTTTKPVWLGSQWKAANTPNTANAVNHPFKISPCDRVNPGIAALSVDEIGTEEEPWDLSMHNINGGNLTGKTTANCYVVTGPGWYKFPVVYGNAYKNGEVNTASFNNDPPGTNDSHYLKPLKDANDNNISKADISGVDGIQLVWQDAQDLINVDDLQLTSADAQGRRYIVFHIEEETIREGNAIIAVKKGNTIFWSWHIWVTPYVKQDVTMRGQTYMARNLGWCEGGTTTWVPRSVVVTFRQPENPSVTKTLTITQTGNEVTVIGSSPHYQWGRKDPLIPPIGITTATAEAANKVWYNASGVASQNVTTYQGPTTIGYSIKNPHVMIYVDRDNLPRDAAHPGWPFGDWIGDKSAYFGSGHYCNLWNYTINSTEQVDAMRTVQFFVDAGIQHGKTVYDPCPIGYTVPLPTEMANLAKSNNQMGGYPQYSGTQDIVWDGNQHGAICNNQLIPANGMRYYFSQSQHVGDVGSMGYYFTSAYCNSHNALVFFVGNGYTPQMSAGYAKGSARSIRCVPE